MVYTNITRSGMSGGSVLDAQCCIIRMHGRAEGEPIFNPDTGTTVDVKSGFNLAIPINTFLKLAFQNGVDLSYLDDNFTLAIDPFGHLLASGSYDGTIKIWNLHTGQLLHTLDVRNARGGDVYVFSVAFSADDCQWWG